MTKICNKVFSDEPLLDEDGISEKQAKANTIKYRTWLWGIMQSKGIHIHIGIEPAHINKKHHELDLICDLADPDAYVMALKKLIKEEK